MPPRAFTLSYILAGRNCRILALLREVVVPREYPIAAYIRSLYVMLSSTRLSSHCEELAEAVSFGGAILRERCSSLSARYLTGHIPIPTCAP